MELGLCYFCGKKAESAHKTCKEHLQLQGDKLRKWHMENGNNSHHIWRKIQAAEVKIIQNNRSYI